jgi:hypothetical protein
MSARPGRIAIHNLCLLAFHRSKIYKTSPRERMKKNDRLEAWLTAWDPEPSSRLPAEYRAFFFCFNQGEYYEAHDVLEHLWLQCGDNNRQFYQGLIQFAGAFVHLQKHHLFPGHPTHSRRLAPACRLFALAANRIGPFGPVHLALDVTQLLETGALWSSMAVRGQNPLDHHPAPKLTLGANKSGMEGVGV